MNPYEKIINLIREQSKLDRPVKIQIGGMKDDKTCKVGEIELSGDDLLVAEHLKRGFYSREQGKQVFIDPLKAGDMVAVYRVNEETYLILGRLVEL